VDGLEGKTMPRRASVERVLDLYIRARPTVHVRIDRGCDKHALPKLHAVRCHKVKKHHFWKVSGMHAHMFKGCISHAGQSLLSIYRIAFIISTIRQ